MYQIHLDSGEIRHENYSNDEELEWTISADCPMVSLESTKFDTESGYDYVTIAGERYEGAVSISISVPDGTVVYFSSDGSETYGGFVLEWSCEIGNSREVSSRT